MSRTPRTSSLLRTCLVAILASGALVCAAATPASERTDDDAIQKLVADYGRAIETRDLKLFKAVKPNLTAEEERRTRAAFDAVKSQTVRISVVSVEIEGATAVVRVSRRDTINSGLVSSFPQTLRLTRGAAGWGIVEIGK